MKRLCLFAGYNKKGLISDYAVYYVQEMAKLAGVYYLASCKTEPQELINFTTYTKHTWAYRHKIRFRFLAENDMENRLGPIHRV